MKTKGGGYTLDMVLIVIGMLVLDALIYLLLELLLDGYSTYYAQSSGSYLKDKIAFREKLVLIAIYIWSMLNLIGFSILFYAITAKRKKITIPIKRISNKRAR